VKMNDASLARPRLPEVILDFFQAVFGTRPRIASPIKNITGSGNRLPVR
jgi:hypothetical protein